MKRLLLGASALCVVGASGLARTGRSGEALATLAIAAALLVASHIRIRIT